MARRPGKYAHVIATLPKMPLVEPDRRDIVDEAKNAILAPPSPDDPHNAPGDTQRCLDTMGIAFDEIHALALRATAGRKWASAFATQYAELRAIKDKLENWTSEINLLIDAYQSLMVEQLEVEGVSSLKLANGQPVSTYLEPYAQVVDKELFRQWCVAQGLERSMHLAWQTTNSTAKQMLLAGDDLPPGVTLFAKTKVRLGAE